MCSEMISVVNFEPSYGGIMKRLLSTTVATTALAVGLVINTSSPAAAAESAPGCPSVTQIGSTGYIKSNGESVVSVKQFKGCGKNWAYAYVWKSFRDSHRSWSISAWIQAGASSEGWRSGPGIEVWSDGTHTLSVCTQALGQLRFASQTLTGHTDTRC
jgi:hypothetical protein